MGHISRNIYQPMIEILRNKNVSILILLMQSGQNFAYAMTAELS